MSIKKILTSTGIVLALVLLISAIAATLWLRGTLPQLDGSLRLPGIEAPATIIRDEMSVPHIFAARETDAYFALGFTHASDRMWQMDLMRRLGAGRLSEIFGPAALGRDRLMRVLGFYRLAQASHAALPPAVRSALAAYADGVNAWLEHSGQNLPVEFALLRYKPEPWQPADSIVWTKLMAWDLSGNMQHELLRARLGDLLSPEDVGDLLPTGIGRGLRAAAQKVERADPYSGDAAARLADLVDNGHSQAWASNVWAIAPERTTTGGAILANDPHLGLSVPIPWYLARLESPGLTVTGATVPGVPFVVLGHNRDLSWGITNNGADVQDLLIFSTDPKDDTVLLTEDGTAPLTIREEIIAVRDAEPERLRVRLSAFGPVISDLDSLGDDAPAPEQALVLAFPALNSGDKTIVALHALNQAEDAVDISLALPNLNAPPLNVGFADTKGQIGLAVAGKIPIRAPNDGMVPRQASRRRDSLVEFIPADRLPREIAPATHWIANANNDPAPPDYPYFLAASFEEDARYRRLVARIEATERHSIEETMAIQTDIVSLAALDLLPMMMSFTPDASDAPDAPGPPDDAALLADLRAWDGTMDRDRHEPLLFAHWLRALTIALFSDELGEEMRGYLSPRPTVLKRVLAGDEHWCDDTATPEPENCQDMLRLSFGQALERLRETHGGDPGKWRWGSEHIAALAHPLFSRLPLLGAIGNLSRPTDGGPFTLNRGGTPMGNNQHPFAHTRGAGFRGVYDMAALDKSRFVIATGQSGNPLSRHYGSFAGLWQQGEYVRIGGAPEALIQSGMDVLTLRPQPDPPQPDPTPN